MATMRSMRTVVWAKLRDNLIVYLLRFAVAGSPVFDRSIDPRLSHAYRRISTLGRN
jgi:hypothetical protein